MGSVSVYSKLAIKHEDQIHHQLLGLGALGKDPDASKRLYFQTPNGHLIHGGRCG